MGLSRRRFLELGVLSTSGALLSSGPLAGRAAPAELLTSPLREATLSPGEARWRRWAINVLWTDLRQTDPTPLIQLTPPFNPRIRLVVKNEARSVTGSLKHRAAWSLLMWGLISGRIRQTTHLYERTSGNTGIAEAYFAKHLQLPFTAVTPASISPGKVEAIRSHGGRVLTPPEGQALGEFYKQVLAADGAACDINQSANAERASGYFEGTPLQSENLANELRLQLRALGLPLPDWFVMAAGTGGTATSIGRYLRKWGPLEPEGRSASLMVVDPEHSVLFDWVVSGDGGLRSGDHSRIEGVGNSGPVVFGQTTSLQRELVDRVLSVPDALTMAGLHLLNTLVGFRAGPSSGLNFIGALRLACAMGTSGPGGLIATVICDRGDRYTDTYYAPAWVEARGLLRPSLAAPLAATWRTGRWPDSFPVRQRG
jgi:cysteine synthase A